MSSKIKTVGVVGTGVIGSSWTALFLSQGLKVLVSDPAPRAEKALASYLDTVWPTLKEIGLASGASATNYKFVGSDLTGYYDQVDFVQENAPERPDVKIKVIGGLDANLRPEVIIASSSSGMPSSKFIAECKRNPERVLIGHPFNPPHLMPLVEVVPHPGCSETAIKQALEIYTSMGKRPVLVKKEAPGFAANRLQAALCNEAYSLVALDILSAPDLDACMTTSLGPRWALTGPFMSNVFGGGGGRDGFMHAVGHLAPAMEGWLKDMNANQVKYDDALFEKLNTSVQAELDMYDSKAVEQQRDAVMVKLLKEKKGASSLV